MSKIGAMGSRLYRGEISFDFVGRKKLWYTLSGVILVLAAVGLFGRGLNLGIEFKGGAEFQVVSTTDGVDQAKSVALAAGVENPIVTQLGNGTIRVQTPELAQDVRNSLVADLATEFNVAESEVRVQIVGPSWGSDISGKALNALIVFLVLVSIFLSIMFEWRMAVAALIALLHDVVITVGIYALTGFEVTPATVIGVLTILGFSLYDTVVVFDKVKENTKNIGRQNRYSYSAAANLALNQTLVRSINTSIVALLPVTALLVIGAGVLGAGTLRDLSLALFVGMLAGTYSSITIATPVLAQLKEREPQMQALAKRATNKAANKVESAEVSNSTPEDKQVIETGPRNQPRRKSRSKR
jgi:preprotein translocase subunit SecF